MVYPSLFLVYVFFCFDIGRLIVEKKKKKKIGYGLWCSEFGLGIAFCSFFIIIAFVRFSLLGYWKKKKFNSEEKKNN